MSILIRWKIFRVALIDYKSEKFNPAYFVEK
jgi:hypothetical protein